MKTKLLLGLALVLLVTSCRTRPVSSTQREESAPDAEAITGTWHLVALDMPADEKNKLDEEMRAQGMELPKVDLRFKTNGTYEYLMTVKAQGGDQSPVRGGDRWSLTNGVLHITAVSFVGSSNLVMQVHLSGGRLTFGRDPVIPPYAFKSVYERTTNNFP